MHSRLSTILLLVLSFPLTPAFAQEEAAILATVDELFVALGNRDRAALEAITVPGSLNISTSPGSNGEVRLSTLNYEELIAALSRPGSTALERYWDATVLVQGSIAVFWAPYDFYVDGEFTHCGIERFGYAAC